MNRNLTLTSSDQVSAHCRLGAVILEGISVRDSTPELLAAMLELSDRIRAEYKGVTAGDLPRIRAVRTMYRTLGVDPHHTRPSSEALFRRVLRGDDLPKVNTVVDAANLWSLTTLTPVGLYDADQLAPPVAFRLGYHGEGYEGIRKDWVNVADRPVLVDRTGPFGNPTSDSLRTAVTATTKHLLAVAFQPRSFPEDEVALLEDTLRRYNLTGSEEHEPCG